MSQIAEPGTVIQIKVDEEWMCHCGTEQPKPGAWVASHWSNRLTHACKQCGTERTLLSGSLNTPKVQKEPSP